MTNIFSADVSVETFKLSNDRPGAFGDEVILRGWALAEPGIARMHLATSTGERIEVVGLCNASNDVRRHYGKKYGDKAGQARFELIEPLGTRNTDLAETDLEIEFLDGSTMKIDLRGQLELASRPGFTEEERDLVMRFENVGDSCELGLVQRLIGTERLGLFRYAGVGDISVVADVIESRFEVLEDLDSILVGPHSHEWMVHVPRARFAMHTGRSIESITKAAIEKAERTKITFLAQKFLDDCESAEKIFVYRAHYDQRGGQDGTRGMDRLYEVLRAMGPNNLLWVNVATEQHPHGSVVKVREGLYRAWIDYLAPHSDAFDFRPRSWLELLKNAYQVIQQEGSI